MSNTNNDKKDLTDGLTLWQFAKKQKLVWVGLIISMVAQIMIIPAIREEGFSDGIILIESFLSLIILALFYFGVYRFYKNLKNGISK